MILNVPHFPQNGPMDCWHAAARMLYAYRHQASIDPLPSLYQSGAGISAAEFIRLAQSVGLRTMPQVSQTFSWRFLEDSLTNYGPLWAAGQWNGPNHIVVITGVESDGDVFVNDPAYLTPVQHDMAWFNDRIDKSVSIPLMYLR